MTLHFVIEYNWLHELGAHKIFFCPLCHCCYIPRAWIRIRVNVWRRVSVCKYIYTYMYVLDLTYISVHMGIVIFLLHIMYYLWMIYIYICPMQLLFNFGNKFISLLLSLTLKIQGQGHGQGQTRWSHLKPRVQSMCLLFASWQSDHFLLRYGQLDIWPWKFKVKVTTKIAQNLIS